MPPSRCLLFTALKGALLEPHSSNWAAAECALGAIERRRVPWILVTSQTRAEIEALRRKISHTHPFITEDGGGIFIPQGYFNLRIEDGSRVGCYQCVPLGRPHAEVVAALEEIAAAAAATVVALHQLTTREVAQNTGLSLRQAELARQREFSEPFFFAGETEGVQERFARLARQRGFEIARRGGFWYLAAGSSVRRAVRRLLTLYRTALHKRLSAVGIGASSDDLALLEAVEHPVLLPQGDGEFDRQVLSKLPLAKRGVGSGPRGWNQAVLQLLGEASSVQLAGEIFRKK